MISSLRGPVVAIDLDSAVIECAGVGCQFLATPRTLGQLRRGEEATVITHLVINDSACRLYGFADQDERRVFLRLQSVSGLGPKLALACLATLRPAELARAIGSQETKTLQMVPGVGRRMAERMVVELKDTMAEFLPSPDEDSESLPSSPSSADGTSTLVAAQVVEALMGLGFSEKPAQVAVDAVLAAEPELDASATLRSALSALGTKA